MNQHVTSGSADSTHTEGALNRGAVGIGYDNGNQSILKFRLLHIFLLIWTMGASAYAGDVSQDGRDQWTLLEKSPVNRQLHEQLKNPDQRFRLWKNPARFAFLVDASSGGQQSLPGTDYDQTRYHGFFIFDGYGSVRLFDALDINLNLNFMNPSFCDGYHKSFQLLAGMSIHLHKKLFAIQSDPLWLQVLLMDLDLVTFGEGLLVEEIPLEGLRFSLDWRHMSLSAQIAARVFWDFDDLLMIPLSFFDQRLQLLTALWYFTTPIPDSTFGAVDIVRASNDVQYIFPYVGLSAHYDWRDQFRISAEYLARIKNRKVSSGVLLRTDYRTRLFHRVKLHAGYQFRFYQRRFAPIDDISLPTTAPQTPERENSYVTNSFEYFAISPWFHQISHTVMAEVQLNLTDNLQLYYELEEWFRWTINRRNDNRVLYVTPQNRAPGRWQDVFYDVGLRYRLFSKLPHRFSIFVSNKWVASDVAATTPMPVRFVNDPLFGFKLEVYL